MVKIIKPVMYVNEKDLVIDVGLGKLHDKFIDNHGTAIECSVNNLVYSDGLNRVYGPGFACCNAVALLDKNRTLAGLAHLELETDPFKLFGGINTQYRRVYGIREKYENPSDVFALHISHNQISAKHDDDIENALIEQGIDNITHVKIDTEARGPYYRRDIGIDREKGECYIFFERYPAAIILKFFGGSGK